MKLSVLLIVLLVSLTYANSLGNHFVMDDFLVIVDNDFVKSFKNLPLLFTKDYMTSPKEARYFGMIGIGSGEISYRPIVTLSYFKDYALWKLNPFGYHLTNLILHILNSLLVYLLAVLLLKDIKIALIAGLLFGLHPVNTEAVNCISFREDLLAFLFFAGAFICYIKSNSYSDKKGIRLYIISVILFLLALFSKEMALTLPLLIICYDFIFTHKVQFNKIISKKVILQYSGYLLALVLYLAVWVLFKRYINKGLVDFQYEGGGLYTNIIAQLKALYGYFEWVFLPIDIHATLPAGIRPAGYYTIWSLDVMTALSIIIALLAIAVKQVNRNRAVSFGIAWFFITLIPVYNIFPLPNQMAARFLYIPVFGFCICMAFILSRVLKIKYGKYILLAVLLFYAMFSFIRNIYWRNNFIIWHQLAEKYPDIPASHRGLGDCFVDAGLYDKAVNEYKTALKLGPFDEDNYNAIAIAYYKKGEIEESERLFNKALELNNMSMDAYNGLANIYADKGQYEKSEGYLKRIIEKDSRYLLAYKNLGTLYIKMGRRDDAKNIWEKALEINPNHKEITAKLSALQKDK